MTRRHWLLIGLAALTSLGVAALSPSASFRPAIAPPTRHTPLADQWETSQPGNSAHLLIPDAGAYTGAYIDFGEHEDDVTLERIDDFARLVGRHQAIIAFSNFWGRGRFPSAQVSVIANSGAIPLVLWNPWDRRDGKRRLTFDLGGIAAGRWDGYIDAWAKEARQFGKPMLVAWGLEMNGTWFPWSGANNGGGEPIPGTHPTRFKGPETFKRAYRHVVDRVRSAGALNVSWLFHTNNGSIPNAAWNRMSAYYPGPAYVDWLAMSAYGKQFPEQSWSSVERSLERPYRELAAVDPEKPILMAEWGIGEFPKEGDKGVWIRQAFAAMEKRMPRLKGAVFWHERWQNKDLSYSNLRANSSLQALTAYREGVLRGFWLDQPRVSTITRASIARAGE